jgi:hypothetical protein
MLGPRKYLGDSDPRVIDEKFIMPEWVCDNALLSNYPFLKHTPA